MLSQSLILSNNDTIAEKLNYYIKLIAFVICMECILFALTLQYEIVHDQISWYFPIGFNILMFFLFPTRSWFVIFLASKLGNTIAFWYLLDLPFIDLALDRIVNIPTYFLGLLLIWYAKTYKIKSDWFTLDAVFWLMFSGIFYRFSYMFLAYLAEFGVYSKISPELLFEYFVAHFLAGTFTYLYFLAGTLLALWILFKKPRPAGLELLVILIKVVSVLSIAFVIYSFQPAFFSYIQVFSFIPLLWFGYKYGFYGIIFSVFTAITLVFLFQQDGTILLKFQALLISALIVALLIGGISLENQRTQHSIVQQKTYLENTNQTLMTKNKSIKNLSLLILDAQEQERKMLSSEISEELTKEVSELQTSINALVSVTNSEKSKIKIGMIKQSIGQIYNSIFELINWLRPRVLDEHGIYHTLTENYFAERLETLGIHYHVKISGERIVLSDIHEITLFRITQEAITNTIKHAQATDFYVNLVLSDYALTLYLADNGKGIVNSDSNNFTHGFGLKGLKHRVLGLNGTFEISSCTTLQEGIQKVQIQGFGIKITLPLK